MVDQQQQQQQQQSKKLSLLEYRKKKEQNDLRGEEIQKEEKEPSIDQKLVHLLDHSNNPIPDRVIQLPSTVMKGETNLIVKLTIIKFILKFNLVPILSDSIPFRDILYNWLKIFLIDYEQQQQSTGISIKEYKLGGEEEEELLIKIFLVLQQIPFTSDYLLNSKYPKIISKFQSIPFKNGMIREEVKNITTNWNSLTKTKGIDEGSGNNIETEIHSKRSSTSNLPRELEEKRRRPKRRVSFAPDDLLVQIRYFEIEDVGEGVKGHRRRMNYHDSERKEASYALEHGNRLDREQIEWKVPPKIEGHSNQLPFVRGSKSEERIIQEEREKKVLSTTYYSIQHIPASPSECINESTIPDLLIPQIPLYEIQQSQSTATGPMGSSGTAALGSFDPNALANLIKNQTLFKSLHTGNKS